MGALRSVVRYQSYRADDTALRARLRELAHERRRFGYRRLNQMLKREGTVVNLKKVRRLYTEERLQVRKRSGRKKALGTRTPTAIPQGANQRSSRRLQAIACRLQDHWILYPTFSTAVVVCAFSQWLMISRANAWPYWLIRRSQAFAYHVNWMLQLAIAKGLP